MLRPTSILVVLFALTSAIPAMADTLLWADNFDVADGPLDSASLDGRLSGLAAEETRLESSRIVQQITGGQLSLAGSGSAVRFGDETNRYDWAGATTGPAILAAGGFTVSFDWTYSGASDDWLAFRFGTPNGDSYFTQTDVGYTILLRENGGNETFLGSSSQGFSGISFTPEIGVANPVSITYMLDSFEDGSIVDVTATVNGTTILSDSFDIRNTGGVLFLEMVGQIPFQIDNLSIAAVPEPRSTGLLAIGGMGLLIAFRRIRKRC